MESKIKKTYDHFWALVSFDQHSLSVKWKFLKKKKADNALNIYDASS